MGKNVYHEPGIRLLRLCHRTLTHNEFVRPGFTFGNQSIISSYEHIGTRKQTLLWKLLARSIKVIMLHRNLEQKPL
jgi:hypothetical protein